MTKKLQAVIFDLDGVITDTAEYHFLAWQSLAEELGIHIDRKFNEQLKGVGRMESLDKILTYGGQQSAFTEEEKLVLTNKKNNHYRELINNITPNDILPGIEKLIKELIERNIKRSVASASRNALTILERLNLVDQFDYIVDAATIKNGKPDPEIFLTAADFLGVSYENCVGIEDALAGVEAIKAADMFAVGVGEQNVLAQADVVVACTEKLTIDMIMAHFYRPNK